MGPQKQWTEQQCEHQGTQKPEFTAASWPPIHSLTAQESAATGNKIWQPSTKKRIIIW